MDHHYGTGQLTPANSNAPNSKQYDAANNLAGELLLYINQESAASNLQSDLVRESLFFSLIPNLMDGSHGAWSAKKLTEAVHRATASWAGIRGESAPKDSAGHLG